MGSAVSVLLATCQNLPIQHVPSNERFIHSTLELVKSGKSTLHSYGSPQHVELVGNNSGPIDQTV